MKCAQLALRLLSPLTKVKVYYKPPASLLMFESTSSALVRLLLVPDTRAFGEFGWSFVNAGEQFRKLLDVSDEEKLMMCGLFKQATMGDCEVEEVKKNGELENTQRNEWLKYKGMDTFDAMKLYIEKVNELAQVYQVAPQELDPSESEATTK